MFSPTDSSECAAYANSLEMDAYAMIGESCSVVKHSLSLLDSSANDMEIFVRTKAAHFLGMFGIEASFLPSSEDSAQHDTWLREDCVF